MTSRVPKSGNDQPNGPGPEGDLHKMVQSERHMNRQAGEGDAGKPGETPAKTDTVGKTEPIAKMDKTGGP